MNIMTKRGSLDNIVTYEHLCDSLSDLSKIPSDQINLGTTAIVLKGTNDELEVYMANSKKQWIPLLEGGSGGSGGESFLDLIHICGASEYSSAEDIPTVEDPEENTIYLVPSSAESGNLYDEWIYVNENWERFGSGGINGFTPDWSISSSGELGYIENKPAIKAGTGTGSILEGNAVVASGDYSHAEGAGSQATGLAAHAENAGRATGNYSHAEGGGVLASGAQAHAEGGGTTASGQSSHAEGGGTTASGQSSHAEGGGTISSGEYSHAEGSGSRAYGDVSHAEGLFTIAHGDEQHVFGRYNIEDTTSGGTYVEIVGNGTNQIRSNARTLDWLGNEWLAGDLSLAAGKSITIGNTSIGETELQALNDGSISSGSSANEGSMLVTFSQPPNSNVIADKTYEEIYEYAQNGGIVFGKYEDTYNNDDNIYMLTSIGDSTSGTHIFTSMRWRANQGEGTFTILLITYTNRSGSTPIEMRGKQL